MRLYYKVVLWHKGASKEAWTCFETTSVTKAIECLDSWVKKFPNLRGKVVRYETQTIYKSQTMLHLS